MQRLVQPSTLALETDAQKATESKCGKMAPFFCDEKGLVKRARRCFYNGRSMPSRGLAHALASTYAKPQKCYYYFASATLYLAKLNDNRTMWVAKENFAAK